MDLLWRSLGWAALVLVGVLMVVNGVYMVLSPTRWWDLPGWIRASGTLRKSQYSSGWGAVQVRITGGLLLAMIFACLGDYFFDFPDLN